MTPFESASYLSQVRRLRDMAHRVLKCYPIKPAACSLINHWENTTFQVTTNKGDRYLLRIHRPGYHTESAILEELKWLERLSATSALMVPAPVPSRNGRLVEAVGSPHVPQQRYCCLLRWIDGHFVRKSLGPSHMNRLGGMIAALHKNAEGLMVVHRRYWDADGLVGARPKFGSIDHIEGIPSRTQEILTEARRLILHRLKRFERAFPQKLSLIHADLHFDNILVAQRELAPIDFDDCGFGFHAYDLAVTLVSAQPAGKVSEFRRMKDALIEGYAREKGWTRDDEEILPFLMAARRLGMVGWLNSRSDNPALKKWIKRAARRTAKRLRKEFDLS